MATSGDINVGSVIRHNGELCIITEYQHRTPGNLRAFYQAKMKNVKNGKSVEYRYRAGEDVELVRIERKDMQYLYADGESLVCMDPESFDQVYIPSHLFGDGLRFMKEEMKVQVAFEGEDPILAEAPTFVVLEVTYAEPGEKGNTATNTLKPCTLETGAVINVPLFVNQGEKIKIDTRAGTYMERVK